MKKITENTDQAISVCNNCGNCKNKQKKELPIKQLESDYVSDIRNHISPMTKVIER